MCYSQYPSTIEIGTDGVIKVVKHPSEVLAEDARSGNIDGIKEYLKNNTDFNIDNQVRYGDNLLKIIVNALQDVTHCDMAAQDNHSVNIEQCQKTIKESNSRLYQAAKWLVDDFDADPYYSHGVQTAPLAAGERYHQISVSSHSPCHRAKFQHDHKMLEMLGGCAPKCDTDLFEGC
jgi:hypothetical protein